MNLTKQIRSVNGENTIFAKTDFYKWLMIEGNYKSHSIDCKLNYLKEKFNFKKGIDKIDGDLLKGLNWIQESYYHTFERCKLKNIKNLNELIIIKDHFNNVPDCHKASKKIPVNNEQGYINGNVMTTPNHHLFTFDITDKLKDCLNKSFSDHINYSGYLQLVVRSDNTLLLTYQYDQIIGSIWIARIENDIPEFLLKQAD